MYFIDCSVITIVDTKFNGSDSIRGVVDKVYGRARLSGIRNVYSSPVAASGRIYITSMDGATVVFTAGANPKMLGQNTLDDSFSASAALAGKEFFLRGDRSLYCIAEE